MVVKANYECPVCFAGGEGDDVAQPTAKHPRRDEDFPGHRPQ